MTLAHKMFDRSREGCGGIDRCSSPEKKEADLFSYEWDVFVVRHNPEQGKFDWFTLCCESNYQSDSAHR